MNKLVKTSKSAIASTAGVCVLLATASPMSADTIKQNEVKVQENQVKGENVGVQDPEVVEGKPQTGMEDKEVGNKEVENKQDEAKQEVKKEEEVKDAPVQEKKEEVKPQTDKLQVVEEKKKEEPQVSRAVASPPKYEQVNILQVIEKSNNDDIWSLPYGVYGAKYIGSVNSYVGKEVTLIKKTVIGKTTWFQFSVNGKTIGWIDSHVLSKITDMQEMNESAYTGVTESRHGIFNLPWGMKGSNWLSSVNKYSFKDLKVIKKATLNNVVWYKVSENGKVLGWLDYKSLNTKDIENTNFTTTIGSSDRHGIWTKPYGVEGSNWVSSTSEYGYQKVQVIKTTKLKGTNWYLVKDNKGVLGWLDGNKATTDIENLPVGNSNAVVGDSKSSDGVWSLPYGEDGANWLGSVSSYKGKVVKVVQRVKKHNVIWSKIELNGRLLGWVDSRTLKDTNIQDENKTVLVGDINGHSIWTKPYGQAGAKYVDPASSHTDKPLKVSKSTVIGGVTWYNISEDGKELGWIDARAISSATNVKNVSGDYHISTNETRHGAWTRPYGFQNAGWVDSLTNFTDKNIKAEVSIDYNGTTWIGFKNQGRMNWLDKQAISPGKTFPRMNVPSEMQRDFNDPSRDLLTGCEITAVSMMLRYAGANVDKISLAKEMPYHPSDPNKGYVGNPWSDGPINTIYPPSLTGLVSKYTGSAIDLTGSNLDKIKDRLNKRHPVVAWVGDMHGFGIHAITLTGYDKDRVYYNDPWTGEEDASMSWNNFNKKWTSKKSRALSY